MSTAQLLTKLMALIGEVDMGIRHLGEAETYIELEMSRTDAEFDAGDALFKAAIKQALASIEESRDVLNQTKASLENVVRGVMQ